MKPAGLILAAGQSSRMGFPKALLEWRGETFLDRLIRLFSGCSSPVVAGLTLATGIGVRGVVLGEVLGAQDGIGHAFARAMSYLDTPRIFAWVLVALGLMAVLEFAVLRPVRARVMRWKK